MTTNLTGWFWGYDPGGHKGNGVAAICSVDGELQKDKTLIRTKDTAAEVVTWFKDQETPLAVGIDTLTRWSGGSGGWRTADHALRSAYDATNSVMSPNGLMGAMSLNGMFVLRRLRRFYRNLYITETHPKVLHEAMTGKPYKTLLDGSDRWSAADKPMREWTSQEEYLWVNDKVRNWLEPLKLCTSAKEQPLKNPHEVDALISAYAAFQSFSGYKKTGSGWRLNLFCDKDRVELVAELHPAATDAEKKRLTSGEIEETLESPTNPITTEPGEDGPVEYRWPHPRGSDHCPRTRESP